MQSFEFSPAERLAAHEAARCIAILEAIDRDLDQRGLVDKEGQPRYLLNHRSRTSRQLEHWLEKVSAAIERQTTNAQAPLRAEFPDYVKALQRIALGQDFTATARDRLAALKELLELGPSGTTSYLERPADAACGGQHIGGGYAGPAQIRRQPECNLRLNPRLQQVATLQRATRGHQHGV